MPNLYVPLSTEEVERLRRLAEREYRDAKTQAAYLIVEGLRRAGLDPERADRSAFPQPEPDR